MVFQEYAQVSVPTQAATLYPCIVGPCYHIIDAENDTELSSVGEYTVAGIEDELFPNNEPGAEIDEDSVTFLITSPIVQLNDSAIPIDSADDNVITFLETDFPEDVETGDIVRFTTDIDGDFIVIGKNAEEFSLILNKTPSVGETPPDIDLFRELSDFEVTDEDDAVTVDASAGTFTIIALETNVNGNDKLVSTAGVRVSYRALRTDLTTINTIYSVNEAKGVLGKIDTHDNPLGLGVATALANTTVGVKCIGVASDDNAGFTGALDRLETYDDVYAIAVLSQEAAILNMFSSHAQQMSQPEQGNWRVAIGSVDLPEVKDLESGNGETREDGEGDLILLADSDAEFMTNDVTPGDTLIMSEGGETYEYTVAAVLSEDLLSIDPSSPFDNTTFTDGSAYDYEIVRELTRTQQAQEVKSISESFGSSRCIHTWPNRLEIDSQDVPGYYLSCAVAGAAGGLPSQHGFTRLSISGVNRLFNSNDYFNQDQLNIIASGGTFIFTQENPQAAPVIRHQLTTDMSTIEMSEFSFVKNFDYVAMLCKEVLDNFLGQYNITPPTLAALETVVRGVLETLKLASQPKIGAPVLGYDVTKVKQLDDVRDRVEMYVEVDFPYPLNTVGLHIISR